MGNVGKQVLVLLIAGIGATEYAQAFTFENESGSVKGSFDSTITFGTGIRAKNPGCDTVIGSVFGHPAQAGNGGPAGCLDMASGYNDQGNLNYKKGDAFTTYLKGTHELLLKLPDSYTVMARANWLKDFTATHTTGYTSAVGSEGSFAGNSESQLNFKARLLDFWVSKSFDLNGEQARIRAGNQVVSWGESLFLPGGINQTNAMDIQRLSQPGTQMKEAMLPAPIIDFATGLGGGFNLEAYVQTNWNANYMPPIGSYWSFATIGNGAEAYAAAAGGNVPTGSKPRSTGQYGIALRYKPKDLNANFGLYAMQYHDKSPSIQINSAGAAQYTYLEDRLLFGASTNFSLGDWAIGAELSYRPRDAVALNLLNSAGMLGCPDNKCYVDEKKYQLNVTGILSMTPGDYGGILKALGNADTATLLAEVAVVKYPGLQSSYRGNSVAAGNWGWLLTGDQVVNANFVPPSVGSSTAWGYSLDFSWTYDGKLIPGWQVTPEIYYSQAVNGRTPNGWGQLMQGAKSANFIVTFTQNPANWAIGVNYAKFWGGSVFDQPMRDKDFFGAYISRNF